MPLIRDQFRAYRATLQPDRRHLLERFEIVDAARKVVGVGSVGTRAFIVLLQGRDAQDPLFLQIKEATASVLEAYLPKSRYRQHGAAGGARAADDAGRQRHLPGLDQGAGREPPLLLAPAARHEGLGAGRADDTARAHLLRPASAGGRWRGRTPGPATRSPSPDTSAPATRSTGPSPTSHCATPTRTSATTRPSSPPSDPGGWKPSKASDDPVRMLAGRRSVRAVKTRGRSLSRRLPPGQDGRRGHGA